MPSARHFLSTSVVSGKIYAIGGTPNYSATEEYDPATDTWVEKTDMPTGRNMLCSGAVNGKIYAIGGGDAPSSTVEEYTPEGWQTSSTSPQDKLTTKWSELKSD
jgi:hypothetical protein